MSIHEQLATPDSSSSKPCHCVDSKSKESVKSISRPIPSITVPWDGGVMSNVILSDDMTDVRPALFTTSTVT